MSPDPFNDREYKLLLCLADGHQLKDIAGMIGSPRVYTRQTAAIMRKKAGANTNAHLVAIALRKGWIK